MVMKIKENLILDILSNELTANKYSKSLLNLKTIMTLEQEENFNFNDNIKKKYNQIIKNEYSLLLNFPLKVLENEYYKAKLNNKKNIDIIYNYIHASIEFYDLYMLLESYYEDIYQLVSIIGNFYNLDVKIKNTSNNNNFI